MTNQPYFVSTAIPFVNGQPHLGHAQEFVITDALARFYRLRGRDVYFLSGTDDNSLKNVQAAEAEGLPTADLVKRNGDIFYNLRQPLDLSYNDFIRTSLDPRHAAGVQKLWHACAANGDIYRQSYGGLYCVGCEQFYKEDELEEGLCPEHKQPPEWVAEENYFFRLSRYEQSLIDLIESDQLRIVPEKYKTETLNFIRRGLEDFSISRSVERARGWGIPVPDDSTQVIYVWYDALGNYITALNYATEDDCYQRYWLNNTDRTHVIGKGIIRFHAIYWPAMLLSAGVPIPTTIYVHDYVTVEGQKISKSLGNGANPAQVAAEWGTDPLRYYLLHEIHTTSDGDFSQARLLNVYRHELANQLGNLLNRVLKLAVKYTNGRVPTPHNLQAEDQSLINIAINLPNRLETAVEDFQLHTAVEAIWELVNEANRYVDLTKPWELFKHSQTDVTVAQRLHTVLFNLLESLRLIGFYLAPFLPNTAARINQQLNTAVEERWEDCIQWGQLQPRHQLQSGEILFEQK